MSSPVAMAVRLSPHKWRLARLQPPGYESTRSLPAALRRHSLRLACQHRSDQDPTRPSGAGSNRPLWPLLAASSLASSSLLWLFAASAWAMDAVPAVAVPLQDDPPMQLSMGNVVLLVLLGYWLVKAVSYLTKNRDDADPQKKGTQEGQSGSPHVQIRTMIDHSHDAQDIRNRSLARAAEYSISTRVSESLPRIHSLLSELSSLPELRRPHAADVDPVANLVWERVLERRHAGGGNKLQLSPAEQQAFEQQLLEAVAELEARSQIQHFMDMASQGALNENTPLAAITGEARTKGDDRKNGGKGSGK